MSGGVPGGPESVEAFEELSRRAPEPVGFALDTEKLKEYAE